jgi:tRNA 2-selenouridine synthase|tara:strand:+ start:68 stop:1078 length:1011 start_codon:yes stop_codon:yes gene_type:complete
MEVPLIDLRTPAEFSRGAFPRASNLPLLTDEERAAVGTTYKRRGQKAAIALGERLVSGDIRVRRVQAWLAFATEHPNAWLYCWRGGMRSATVQSWLHDAGMDLPRVEGGYKRLRALCINTLEAAADDQQRPWLMLGGRTGTGKTEVLTSQQAGIDLEGLANHRGSAFGARDAPQPTPIAFENALAADYLRHRTLSVLLEDESRAIGRVGIPGSWFARMQRSPVVILEASLEERGQRIAAEYVREPMRTGKTPQELEFTLRESLGRISRRLGGRRHKLIDTALSNAFAHGDHTTWITMLLKWYYDPMYDYQLRKKKERIVFSGSRPDVIGYLENWTR